ncbi:hypothetical protein DIPPA_64000 [Diplonema papillatum]|nr:hypothetical protein DIPPA_64001 [Diplonema papillatum]KAJ9455009.1 hypothetical protein DIPPA_64000 [Diplonema papillatum]
MFVRSLVITTLVFVLEHEVAVAEPIAFDSMVKEVPHTIRSTTHFLIGEGVGTSLVKATVDYQCQSCGAKRVKRLQDSTCWECGSKAPISAIVWPGCDPREHEGGICPGTSQQYSAVLQRSLQLSSDKPDKWSDDDRQIFTNAMRAAIVDALPSEL